MLTNQSKGIHFFNKCDRKWAMKDFIQLLKLPPSILAAVAMGTGLILFLPIKILQMLS